MSNPLLTTPCPLCHALNRIPTSRLGDHPQCGQCHSPLLLNQPLTLTGGNFQNQIGGDIPLLVDVWAAWCGPCQLFAPIFEQAAAELQGHYRLAKLDSEAYPLLAGQLNIRSIPCLILFHQGRERQRHSGAFSLPQLKAWLTNTGL